MRGDKNVVADVVLVWRPTAWSCTGGVMRWCRDGTAVMQGRGNMKIGNFHFEYVISIFSMFSHSQSCIFPGRLGGLCCAWEKN